MSGLFVHISSPTGGVVGRKLHIQGSVSGAGSGAVNSVFLTIAGARFNLNAHGRGGCAFVWDGFVPANVGPGQAFSITVEAFGTINVGRIPGEPEPESVDGSASVDLALEYVVPSLTVVPFQVVTTTADATYTLVLRGYFSEGGDPSVYAPQLTYQTQPGVRVPLVYYADASWQVDLPLSPGSYPIAVQAVDAFGSRADFSTTLTVLRYTGPVGGDASVPKTLTGVPTTASVTSWTRLEPQCAKADFQETTSARLFDPLWLMTRQWQVGEFQGEDAGSPVQARVRSTNAMLSRAHYGELSATSTTSRPYNPAKTPLETIVERRRMRPANATDARMLTLAVDAGLQFLRMLEPDPATAKYRAAFLAKYALQPLSVAAAAAADSDTLRFVATMAGRAPDARLLAPACAALAVPANLPDPALAVVAADVDAVRKVAAAWAAAYNGLFTEPDSASDAWVPQRLEYAVSVSARLSAQAPDELTLSASEYGGGRLDWSSFDANTAQKVDSTGDKSFKTLTELTIPAPVSIRGAPAARFWEMEDAKIAYGLLTAGPTDLAHLMMIEYASSYGNDWFVVPVTVPVGSVTRVESLVVTDTFGVRSLLRPMGDPALPPANFSMWQQSTLRAAGAAAQPPVPNRFFLAPTISRSLDGAPLEDVLFMRDEMANLAWAIERSVEGPVETAVSQATAAPALTIAPPAAGAPPRYVLSTVTPPNWIPLMPVQTDASGTVQLRRAATLQTDGSTKPRTAKSEVLRATSVPVIYDEEVPREGVRVTRRRRMSRWIDGSTWVWTGYHNEVGRGEGSAGLRFDQVADKDPGP